MLDHLSIFFSAAHPPTLSRARADGEAVGLEPRLGEDSKLCVGKQASNLDHMTRQSVEDSKLCVGKQASDLDCTTRQGVED